MSKELDNNNKLEISLKTQDGKAYEVTEKGSLGLLALGHLGLLAWRRKRAEVKVKKT